MIRDHLIGYMYIEWIAGKEVSEHEYPAARDSEATAQSGHRTQDSARHQGPSLRLGGNHHPRFRIVQIERKEKIRIDTDSRNIPT